ncbi:MAG: FAD-dependent oxidoreductase [Pseudomonadota bacterium]
MKSSAQVVVIGGGLVGCSILYHLCKLGWTDVVLLERDELTSGSTWHAAAGTHGLHDVNNISRLQYYTMHLYPELEKETGQSCGLHRPGSLYLAASKERMHQLRIQTAKARHFGVDFRELTIAEAQDLHPFLNLDGIYAAMYEADAGHVDPSGVTHAYAAGAKKMGAEIYRFTPVVATTQRADGGWDVETDKGAIRCEAVVNAAGLWGREVARLAGIELPLMTLEHQYFVTDDIPAVVARETELPLVADRDGEYYLRQEGNGMLIGAYERDGRYWAEEGTPLNFGHELLPDDLDRITENVERACHRMPLLADAGVKRVINGPMIWSPDSSALVGPVPELKNYYCCNGIIPGFSQSGGLGMAVAQWIVEGEPEFDLFQWDVTRFGEWADKAYTKARTMDCYTHRFKVHFPYEERDAGRPAKTRPVFEKQQSLGAVFGFSYGWEHPLWYARDGEPQSETYSFERQNWFESVGKECSVLREKVGVVDISNFAKYEIKGAGAYDWLDSLLANKIPTEIGRTCLAPMISVRGGVAGDFTVTKLDDDHFFMVGSGIAERYHHRYFNAHALPEGTTFSSASNQLTGFNIAGPNARSLLEALTESKHPSEDFAFMRSRKMVVAGIDSYVIRVSFTGDLGYEIYVDESDQLALYEAILSTGAELGIEPVGSRALLSLRVEKGYGSWGREYSPEYWPQEVGLERLVKHDKGEFLNRAAYLNVKDNAPRERVAVFEIEVDNADAVGGEPIFNQHGKSVGRISSGAYGFTVGKSLGIGMVMSDQYKPGETYDIAILGESHKGVLLEKPPFDANGKRLRA